MPGYCDKYTVHNNELSLPLPDLFQEQFLDMSYNDLISECEVVFNGLEFSPDQAKIN